MTTPFERGKQVLKMHIAFDDGTKNIWNAVASTTWRYEGEGLGPTPGHRVASKPRKTRKPPAKRVMLPVKVEAAKAKAKAGKPKRGKPKVKPKAKPKAKAKKTK